MKERPILMSTSMVQSTMKGLKTMTRRLMKPQIRCDHSGFMEAPWKDDPTTWGKSEDGGYGEGWYCSLCGNGVQYNGYGIKCPYGSVGDILWVREKWRKYCYVDENGYTHFDDVRIEYAADNPGFLRLVDGDGFQEYNKDGTEKFVPWRPSIFLPKQHCRLYLEITGIRVERLQDITEADAIAEGIESGFYEGITYYKDYIEDVTPSDGIPYFPSRISPIMSFQTLWGSINTFESWVVNPWVWVISFKIINRG